MIRKYLKYFKIQTVDVLIYYLDKSLLFDFETQDYIVKKRKMDNKKICFSISVDGKVIHESYLYNRTFILRLINKKGPTIGDCKTIEGYRGKAIYPFVINYIAKQEILSNNIKEVFIIVNSDNASSIKGIEKAGFKMHTRIKTKKFLLFYFKVNKLSNLEKT
ncbi:hypothetical protein [Flavobacterium sp.]|uniref:hypothetical protein n=1 Tax=Flavobacterium sp. TaxID=239 RepID=UPI0025CDB6A7|nr:hypothetical protein [Flavobacterium sp.]